MVEIGGTVYVLGYVFVPYSIDQQDRDESNMLRVERNSSVELVAVI